MRIGTLSMVAAAALLGGCDAKVGNEAGRDALDANGQASAEGKSEEGKFAIRAPGFELTLDMPIEKVEKSDHSGAPIYPGSTLTGIYVAGTQGEGEDEVELRFRSDGDPATVAAWYRDPARAGDFTLSSAGREDADFVAEGQLKADKDRFKVRLSPRSGGGTDGRLVLRGRG